MWVNDNKDKLGWSPNPCRFSKNHTMYKKDACESKPQQLVQTSISHKQLEAAHKIINKFANYSKASDIPDSSIPTSFDLRNVGGVNYAGKVRD